MSPKLADERCVNCPDDRGPKLPEVLDLKSIAVYGKRATGEKFSINPKSRPVDGGTTA